MPAAVEATCNGADGVTATNTAADSNRVVADEQSGGVALGFIDNASDPQQMKALEGTPALAAKYSLIPIAVSRRRRRIPGRPRTADPWTSRSPRTTLTPNMLAGIISGQYQSPQGNIQFNTPPERRGQRPPGPPARPVRHCSTARQGAGVKALGTSAPVQRIRAAEPVRLPASAAPTSSGRTCPTSPPARALRRPAGSATSPTPRSPDRQRGGCPANPVSVAVTDPHPASTTLISPPVGSTIWPPVDNPTAVWPFPSTC